MVAVLLGLLVHHGPERTIALAAIAEMHGDGTGEKAKQKADDQAAPEHEAKVRPSVIVDHHQRTHRHLVEELDDIVVAHADAAMAARFAQGAFIGGAVDVDPTIKA